jgi:hypothetical protein
MIAENLSQERFMITPDEDQSEGLAEDYDVSRKSQDRFALRSHQKAIAATDEKRFREEIVPADSRCGERIRSGRRLGARNGL